MYKPISVKRLTVGMYVSLKEIPWYKHPFLVSSFEITKPSEIKDILALGRETVLYSPQKSKSDPLEKDLDIKITKSQKDFTQKTSLKTEKASELRKRRKKFQAMEQEFSKALEYSKSIVEGIKTGQIAFYEEAKTMATSIAETFLEEVELSVNHINVTASDEGQHFHSLNVMVLALMLGKELNLNRDKMEKLSFGALMHDVGMLNLPKKLALTPKLSKAEMEELRKHPKLGVSILSQLPDIDREVMKIVYQHHEECNGKGYPRGLKCDDISKLSRIVALANLYDRMINTRDPSLALSPHKALAVLFGKYERSVDPDYLATFIKLLGVYPPGTVCRFSSGDVGIVMSVDPKMPLNPEVIIYDPAIPKHDAIIYKLGVDLDMEIETTLNYRDVDAAALNYLDSRANIMYFPKPK
ncbi:HD domain-containing phosphohydrolase [Pseudodesulfovibrio sp. zrk46]|uniref:HD-GYP domain-containing protein n=1 Tax=Pseudodesulfovibrio sp. zrk46 TaxID=2725288 RepID=UPI001449BB4A|nr:HD domain-containing phosphohydrolase [Pseudodesulfovibrio sp. zrk46]QJB56047.1 DUF3391 domain-containing protein [Pseudodesulfovibrio sp. zrk46]